MTKREECERKKKKTGLCKKYSWRENQRGYNTRGKTEQKRTDGEKFRSEEKFKREKDEEKKVEEEKDMGEKKIV